jgi:hypothetical protein
MPRSARIVDATSAMNNEFSILYIRVAFFAVVAALAAVDLYLLGRYGQEATISNLLREWGEHWGLLPYLVAFGMGCFFYHLFGPR